MARGGPASYLYGLAEVSYNQSFPELHGQVAPAMRDEKELLSFLDICSAPRRFDLHERDVIVAVILVTLHIGRLIRRAFARVWGERGKEQSNFKKNSELYTIMPG